MDVSKTRGTPLKWDDLGIFSPIFGNIHPNNPSKNNCKYQQATKVLVCGRCMDSCPFSRIPEAQVVGYTEILQRECQILSCKQ